MQALSLLVGLLLPLIVGPVGVAAQPLTVSARTICGNATHSFLGGCFSETDTIQWRLETTCDEPPLSLPGSTPPEVCVVAPLEGCDTQRTSRGDGYLGVTNLVIGDSTEFRYPLECLYDPNGQEVPLPRQGKGFGWTAGDKSVAVYASLCSDYLCNEPLDNPITINCPLTDQGGPFDFCQSLADNDNEPYKWAYLRLNVPAMNDSLFIQPRQCYATPSVSDASQKAVQWLFDGCNVDVLTLPNGVSWPVLYQVHAEGLTMLRFPVFRMGTSPSIDFIYIYCEVALCNGPNCLNCPITVVNQTTTEGIFVGNVDQAGQQGTLITSQLYSQPVNSTTSSGAESQQLGVGPLIMLGDGGRKAEDDEGKRAKTTDLQKSLSGPVAPILFVLIGVALLTAVCFPIVRGIQLKRAQRIKCAKDRNEKPAQVKQAETTLEKLRAKQRQKIAALSQQQTTASPEALQVPIYATEDRLVGGSIRSGDAMTEDLDAALKRDGGGVMTPSQTYILADHIVASPAAQSAASPSGPEQHPITDDSEGERAAGLRLDGIAVGVRASIASLWSTEARQRSPSHRGGASPTQRADDV
ncbi:unnamed protein product [Vitrella brassicaformis CCMP3155]|uniref:Uncharacterized protein n=2 Tax=Vitrella brassicaformis TaxID=1169539 RepID=A0A0G4G331_VITBC|nr:unnamed protein product [Vitrella brassicaformis CCMP3155]|eukprot:CEM22505.1 unnamed protein product [Vitrella brassicaformis CCMP3155]